MSARPSKAPTGNILRHWHQAVPKDRLAHLVVTHFTDAFDPAVAAPNAPPVAWMPWLTTMHGLPELLGGPETLMIGRVLWDEFFSNNDWPMASAVAVVMVLLIIVPLALFNKYQAEAQEAGK